MVLAGEFWAEEEEEEEEDDDEDDEEVEEEEDEEDVSTGCWGLCPFLLNRLTEVASCLGSAAGDRSWAGTVTAGSEDSTGAGDIVRGDDCFDACCLSLSSPGLKGGVELFLPKDSSFADAGVGLKLDSTFGPLTGLTASFFSDTFFFLSFFPFPCF